MKVVHKNGDDTASFNFSECLLRAKELEAVEDAKGAIKLYQKCIRLQPANEQPYNRLMILLRKQKEYQKELDVIAGAITVFQKLYNSPRKTQSSNTINRLSKALLKATGLADSKGKVLFEQQPIPRWRKREMLLRKRLNMKQVAKAR